MADLTKMANPSVGRSKCKEKKKKKKKDLSVFKSIQIIFIFGAEGKMPYSA